MEPEIIRMYSSSPPPLDSVADDDDDDGFGEFGGFSDVNNSGLGFADFDSVGYPKTREDFIPSKHFLPIHDFSDNVNNFSSLTSITANENISEIGISKKGPCPVFETNINHDTTQFNVAALDNKGSSGENAKYLHSETHLTCVDNVDLISRSQEQIVSTCNGEKIHSLENLTNGFAAVDGDNPQGLQDLDRLGHSKGFKSISSHSTDLSIDFSPPSPGDDFADFATFASKDSVDVDEAQLQPPKGSHEGQPGSISISTESSRSEHGGVSAATEVLQDPFPQEEPDPLALDSVPPHEAMSDTLDSDSMHSLDTKNTEKPTQCRKEEEQTINEITSLSHHESLETSKDVEKIELDSDIESDHTVNVCHDEPEFEAFGDFDAALPVTDNVTLDKKHIHEPLELPSSLTEVEDDEFGNFEDTNVAFPEEQAGPSEKLSSEDQPSHEWASEELDEFSEFGSFASLAKKEESNVKQDTDDFADFSTAGNTQQPSDWNAFEDDQQGSSSWAAFGDDKVESSAESEDWQSFRTDIPSNSNDPGVNTQSIDLPAVQDPETTLVYEESAVAFQNPLLSRLERIVQTCFPPPPVAEIDEKISPLDLLLCTEQPEKTSKSMSASSLRTEVLDIWTELQDIHDAYGLKYQWGGSHSNKKLLCSLGIDTRNILFTGNKKQPVIVPMYAAGLGMLEPTKEPLKPLSAAEKIASIGQSSPVPPDDSICTSDQLQESLPPVQFDWSSSGLTNPLDGVDPELYALTTAKVESSNASSKVTDAFARLMSTAETTSTSTRKPRRDENLSEEAAKVIASLPDLSFMHAKVLMFPVSLTPLTTSQDKVD